MARTRMGWHTNSREDCLVQFDFSCLPHGFYSLIPAVLSTLAFWTAVVQDGCDYVKLEGGSVEQITASDLIPYVIAGLTHFMAPVFSTEDSGWALVFTGVCEEYPGGTTDMIWTLAKYFAMVSAIFGGSLALFLWFTTCLTFSIRTWRFCAVQAVLATVFRACTFLAFASSVCTGNGSQCTLAFGSEMDVVGVVLYAMTAITIMSHYPAPNWGKLTDEEIIHSVTEAENMQPKLLSVALSQRSARVFAGGDFQ
jgi:hypothetical protein